MRKTVKSIVTATRKNIFLYGLGLLLCLAPTVVNAQLCTLTAGGATYTIPAASHYDATQTSNFTGVGTGDYIFEDGWWFRVSGDTQEFFFPAPTTTTCAGAGGTITWSDVSARGLFSATNTLALSSSAANTGELVLTMSITNLSAVNPLTITLFHGADFDVNGTAGTDNATLITPNTHMRVTDTTAGSADYRASSPAASAFLVRPFAATTDVFGVLGDTSLNNFDNTTLPLNSADFTGAYQWDLNIPASGTSSVSVALTGNVALPTGASADLAITKTDGVASYTPGGSTTYTIVASNSGPDAATGVTVADTFAAVLSCSTTSVAAGGATGNTAGPFAGNINNSGITLPSGASVTYTSVCSVSGAASGNLVNTATVASAITDPDPANNSATDTDTQALPTLSVNDITQSEGNGTSTFTFTVSLSSPAPAGGVTFDIATANGSAIAGSDYTANSATGQTIAAGNSTSPFVVTVNGDTTFEPDEVFLVNVTNPTNATIADGQGIGRITNDEALPSGTFCNSGQIDINDNAAGSPYPSGVAVSGLTGVVSNLTVDINGLSTSRLGESRLLLVAPTGERFILMASVSGTTGANVSYVTYRIDDAATNYFSQNSADPSGSYRPSNLFNLASLPAAAPAASAASPYNAMLNSARGLAPNGTWNLYVADTGANASLGAISGGWCLNISTAAAVAAPFNQVFTGSLAAGDTQQTGRMNRFGVISLPTAPKPYPGDFSTTGARYYDSYSVTNNNLTPQPVISSLYSECGTNIFFAAYLGSFNPTNVGQNYLGDPGSSFPTQSTIMGFILNPGQTAVFVVHEVNVGIGCASYGLRVEGNLNLPITTAPVLTAPAAQNASEGTSTAFNLGSFVDPDDGPWNVTVNWGDASPNTTFSAAAPGSLGTQNHTYAENGVYNVSVTVTDGTALSDSETFQVTVANVAPSGVSLNLTNTTINEGGSTSLSGSFTDPGTLDTHTVTIDWGDGSANTVLNLAAGVTTIPPTVHTYADDDPVGTPTDVYTIFVQVSDDDGGTVRPTEGVVGSESANGSDSKERVTAELSPSDAGGVMTPAPMPKGDRISPSIPEMLDMEAPITSTMMPIPAQSNTFPGNVRGYWFTAPASFTISGLRIPTDADSGPQSIAVVLMPAPPPVFSTTTNTFTTLFLTQSNANSGVLPVNIPVTAGQHIGVLGYRSTLNSYGPGDHVTSIQGSPVTLYRFGMQFNLTTTAPRDLWQEFGAATSISRIELYYTTNASINVTVNNVAPTATFSNGGPYVVGQAGTVSFSGQADPSAADLAGLRYSYDLDNNGTFDIGDGTYGGSVVVTSAAFPAQIAPGSYTVRGRVIDDDTGFTDYTTVVVVGKANTTTTVTALPASPSIFGQSVTFTATVAVVAPGVGTPTGTVSFNIDGNIYCANTPLTAGLTATCTQAGLPALPAGVRNVVALYSGNASFNGSAGTNNYTVNKASTTIAITGDTPDPTIIGQPYAVTWAVSVTAPGAGTPTGTVTVSDGSATCSAPVGAGTCNLTSTTAGNKTLVATYSGDANFNGSVSAGVPHVVNLSISGTVRNGITLAPASGVQMVLLCATPATTTTTTNAAGQFTFTGQFTGPCELFPNLSFTEPFSRFFTPTGNITGADFLVWATAGGFPRTISFPTQYVAPGAAGSMPIIMNSLNNEASVAFSFTYDINPFSQPPVVVCGADAPGCTVTNNTSVFGRVGFTVTAAPGGFSRPNGTPLDNPEGSGPKEIARINFQTAVTTTLPSTDFGPQNSPTAFSITEVGTPNSLTAVFLTGARVVFAQGREGDVAARNAGSGTYDATDLVQMRRFISGLDTPVTTHNEFQRADTAPAASKGDGSLNATDLVQARRYVAGLDAAQSAGGAGAPAPAPLAPPAPDRAEAESEITIGDAQATNSTRISVPVSMKTSGTEVAASFTLRYDETRLTNPNVTLADGAPEGAVLTFGKAEPGYIRILIDSTAAFGNSKDARLVDISFEVLERAPSGDTSLEIEELVFSDAGANQTRSRATNGTISIAGSIPADTETDKALTRVRRPTVDLIEEWLDNNIVTLRPREAGETQQPRTITRGRIQK